VHGVVSWPLRNCMAGYLIGLRRAGRQAATTAWGDRRPIPICRGLRRPYRRSRGGRFSRFWNARRPPLSGPVVVIDAHSSIFSTNQLGRSRIQCRDRVGSPGVVVVAVGCAVTFIRPVGARWRGHRGRCDPPVRLRRRLAVGRQMAPGAGGTVRLPYRGRWASLVAYDWPSQATNRWSRAAIGA
jgi:hypothetical protein